VRPVDGTLSDEGLLARDRALLEAAWLPTAHVERGTPRLLQRGERRSLVLPSDAVSTDEGCTTVAVLGERNVSFVLGVTSEGGLGRSLPVASRAGLAEVSRCGPRRKWLQGLSVHMRSPRGVLEWVVATSGEPLPQAGDVLPSREVGPLAPPPALGPRPRPLPLARRARGIEENARREGAVRFVRASVNSDRAGRGALPLRLDAGCHRIEVLADAPVDAETGGHDIDAALRDLETGEQLVQDDGESGDANLTWCVGESREVRLAFVGAPGGSSTLVTVASWALPPGLPASWGPTARARLAQAVGLGVLGSLVEGPVDASLGVQGHTWLPLELEPGACYVVGVASLRAEPASLALGVQTGPVRRENHALPGAQGVALSFCAAGRATHVEVQSSGYGLAWMLGVWRTSRLQSPRELSP
jgi:hypothetical protein